MKIFKFFIAMLFLSVSFISCDPNRGKATVAGSQDTNNVNRVGASPVTDTNTINADRKKYKQDSVKGDTTNKGNVAPSGRIK